MIVNCSQQQANNVCDANVLWLSLAEERLWVPVDITWLVTWHSGRTSVLADELSLSHAQPSADG